MSTIVSAFENSLRGLRAAARSESAVRRELATVAAAVPAAALVSDGMMMWAALVGVVVLILAVELLNTALERLCDHVTPEHHATIGLIKDLGSAAVLCAIGLAALAWGAAIVSLLFG